MADMSDADFASYVDRIMACRDAEDAAKADTKLVYAAAADAGIDKTALGLFVRIERMDQTQVIKANRKDELTEEYRARYRRGKASHVRVREAAADSTTPNTSVPAGFDPETGEEVTTHQSDIGQPISDEPRDPAPQESAQMPSDHAVLSVSPAEVAVQPSPAGAEGIVDRQPIQPDHVPDTGKMVEANEKPEASGMTTPDPLWSDAATRKDADAEASGPPLYAEPGIVVMEHTGPEPYAQHPYAECWPIYPIDVTGGVREPIVKIGTLILDGRGRFLAARSVRIADKLTMEYPTVQYDGADPLLDSIRWNLASRTMSPQARAIVMGKLQKLAPEREGEIEDLFLAMAMEDRQAAE